METSLKNNIINVFVANSITLCVNLLTNFLLPRETSVNTYVAIKTFQLYMTYVGVFHFGYIDGMYLEYGGKSYNALSTDSFQSSIFTFRIFQATIALLAIIISFFSKDMVLLAFAVAIFPVNIIGLYRMVFQAVGDFVRYKRITNSITLLTCFSNVVLCLIVRTDNYIFFLSSYILIYCVTCALIELSQNKKFSRIRRKNCFSLQIVGENIKNGFSLMCGNLASFILTGMDRWFVKFTMDAFAFAQYSFAVSLENMINIATTSIVIPLYHYLCKYNDKEHVGFIQKSIMIFSVLVLCFTFIAEIAIKLLVPMYEDGLEVVVVLFLAQAIQFVIKAVFVNIYKVRMNQKRYFTNLVVVLIIGFVLNFVFFRILNAKEAYAYATLFSSLVWLVLVVSDYREVFADNKIDYVYYGIELVIFAILGLLCDPIRGLLLYLGISGILTYIFYRDFIVHILRMWLETQYRKK